MILIFLFFIHFQGYCIAVSVLICFHLLRSFKSNSTLDQGFYTITCDVEYFKYDVQGNSA